MKKNGKNKFRIIFTKFFCLAAVSNLTVAISFPASAQNIHRDSVQTTPSDTVKKQIPDTLMNTTKDSLMIQSLDTVDTSILPSAIVPVADTVKTVSGQSTMEHTVTGIVTDSFGEPLAGASILVKGESLDKATITDVDGHFTLSVPENSVLLISYIGFKDTRISVRKKDKLKITMTENTELLNDVVVVGYGTERKSDLTGSIASVSAEDIKNVPAKSVAEALQGKVAGVMVSKRDGKPGSGSDIVIRGVGSINGLNPLFIIDGVSIGNSTNYNLSDIESIEVIKDASAAAIYGSRAAGGVVLITTKKGNYNAKPEVSVSGRVGFHQLANNYELLGTSDYIRVKQALGENYPIWSNPANLPDTDWINELYRTGIEQSYNVSLTGGGKRFRYYLAGAYDRENGTQIDNYWERISARLNVDYNVVDNVTVGTKIYFARVRSNPYTESFPWVSIPYMNIYDENGSFSAIPEGIDFSGSNPYASIKKHHYKSSDILGNADLSVNWEIVKGLQLNVTGAARFGGGYDDNYTEANKLGRSPSNDSYTKSLDYNEEYTFTSTLTYGGTFGKNNLKVMVGYEAKMGKYASLSSTANDFPIDNPLSFNLSTNKNKTASGALTNDRFMSLFGRINYSFDDRYLLTVNFRRDGSPKFSPKNRWGNFPSVSVGWKISEEPFFRRWNPSWLNLIKPRFSWGILGNDQALGNFAYMASFENVTQHSFDGSAAVGGYNAIKVVNEDIKWESIYNTNVGIDIEMFRNRLAISFDYYQRITRNMIYALPTPNSSGITQMPSLAVTSTIPVNIGRIDNKGWELLVSFRDNVGDFSYAISGNVSQNTNEVIDLGLPTAHIYGGGGHPNTGPKPCRTVNGMPVSSFWGLKTDGLITSQAEIDALNANAKAHGHEYYHQRLTGVGDLKFVDLNGDGTINDDDCTFIGNPWPSVQYGINLTLGFKGIDLSAFFSGVAGVDVMNLAASWYRSSQESANTTPEIFKASYFLGNGLTDNPRVMGTDPENGNAPVKDPNFNYQRYSDYLVEDGSYFKLKNITLGYTFPARWTRKIGMNKLRIYFTGSNLWTVTKFSGLDPEFANSSKTAYGLYTGSTYPQTRMFSAGLDITF